MVIKILKLTPMTFKHYCTLLWWKAAFFTGVPVCTFILADKAIFVGEVNYGRYL